MKHLIIILIIFFTSCNSNKLKKIEFDKLEILKTNTSFWKYRVSSMNLSEDFIALNERNEQIGKTDFFNNIATGDYLPMKIVENENKIFYKLFLTNLPDDNYISLMLKSIGEFYKSQQTIVGKPFPNFKFKSIDGIEFNNENIKNKIVVVKTWFIHCVNCIAEFEELNNLVLKNKSRKDILFLSLAFDNEDKLKLFLETKKLLYNTICVTQNFIEKDLGLTGYPRHIIVDKNGIVKSVSSIYEMEKILGKM